MSGLILPGGFNSQPQYLAPAAARWLNRGLIMLASPFGESVMGYQYTTTGTVNRSVNAGGIEWDLTPGANKIAVGQTNQIYIKTGTLTVIALFRPAVTTRGDVVTKWNNGGAAGDQFDLLYGITSGKPQFYISSGAGTQNSGVGTTVMSTGVLYAAAGRWTGSGGEVSVWLNGKKEAAANPGAFTLSAGNQGQTLLIGNTGDGNGDLSGYVSLVALFDGALTDAEIIELTASPATSPYKLYQAPKIFALTSTGGSNISYTLTGNSITASAGTPVSAIDYALTGSAATFSAGTLVSNPNYGLSGSAGTFSAGTIYTSISYSLSGIAASYAAGAVVNEVSFAPSGIASTFSAGSLVPVVAYTLTGVSGTFSAGNVSATGGDVSITLTGSSVAVTAGNLTAGVNYSVSGNSATLAPGSVTQAVSYTLNGITSTFSAGTLTASGGVTPAPVTWGKTGGLPKRKKKRDWQDHDRESRRTAITAQLTPTEPLPPAPLVAKPPVESKLRETMKRKTRAEIMPAYVEQPLKIAFDDEEEELLLLL